MLNQSGQKIKISIGLSLSPICRSSMRSFTVLTPRLGIVGAGGDFQYCQRQEQQQPSSSSSTAVPRPSSYDDVINRSPFLPEMRHR